MLGFDFCRFLHSFYPLRSESFSSLFLCREKDVDKKVSRDIFH